MRFLHRHRPSPAMVVALIALLVALGGTSIAAVTAALPKNSVGTAQLKGNAVTSEKIKNGQVKPADLSASAKTSGPQGPQGVQGVQGIQGPQGPTGPAGVASPGYVAQVASDTSTSTTSTGSASFVDLTGAEETITVPTGETARLYVWFTAESACTGGTWCSVRITVDGTEIEPAAGTNYAFDSVGADLWDGHALVRVSGTLTAGSHVVKVQGAVVGGGTLSLDDWALVVQRVKLT